MSESTQKDRILASIEEYEQSVRRDNQFDEIFDILGLSYKYGIIDNVVMSDAFPSYDKRRNVVKDIFISSVKRIPMTDEEIDILIRASFRIVPLSPEENYTVDEVVRCAIEEKRHLYPTKLPEVDEDKQSLDMGLLDKFLNYLRSN